MSMSRMAQIPRKKGAEQIEFWLAIVENKDALKKALNEIDAHTATANDKIDEANTQIDNANEMLERAQARHAEADEAMKALLVGQQALQKDQDKVAESYTAFDLRIKKEHGELNNRVEAIEARETELMSLKAQLDERSKAFDTAETHLTNREAAHRAAVAEHEKDVRAFEERSKRLQEAIA